MSKELIRLKIIESFRPLSGNEFKNMRDNGSGYEEASSCFRPLSGNEFKNLKNKKGGKKCFLICFRPLSGNEFKNP